MRTLAAALVLLLAAGAARAGLFGRDKIESRWAAKPPPVNADDSDWDASSAFEDEGLSLQAMNDDKDLTLLVTAHTHEVEDQLNGEAHQDVTVWFLAADGKTREWGARLPFSHRAPVTAALRDPAGIDPEPELLRYDGPVLSTAAWPAELADRLGAFRRRPIWELKIPLARARVGPERTVPFDFEVTVPRASPISYWLRVRLAAPPR